MFFNISDLFDINSFVDKFLDYKLVKGTYMVYCKVRYSGYNFFMCGNQFYFNYKSDQDIKNIYNDNNLRLEIHFSNYLLVDDNILYIQLSFMPIDKVYSDY